MIKPTTRQQFLDALVPGAKIDMSLLTFMDRLDLNVSGTAAAPIQIWNGTFSGCKSTSPQQDTAALRINGDYIVWTSVTASGNEGVGISIYGNNVTLNQPTSINNGTGGIGGSGENSGCKNATVVGAVVSGNNKGLLNPSWKGHPQAKLVNGRYILNPGWEGGGGKWYKSTNLKLTGWLTHDNNGPGIWLDAENAGYLLQNCESYNNADPVNGWGGMGIAIEINSNGTLQNCKCHDNSGSDLGIMESTGVLVDGCSVNTLEFRNIAGREFAFGNNTVQNTFIGSGVGFSIGSAPVTMLNNTFGTAQAKAEGVALGEKDTAVVATPPPAVIVTPPPVTPAIALRVVSLTMTYRDGSTQTIVAT